MTGGLLPSRWTANNLSQSFLHSFSTRQFAAQLDPSKLSGGLEMATFLLEVTSAVQSRIVNKLDNLAGCPVTASPLRTLNTCKGVIRCAPLVDCNKDETVTELKPQGVSGISNITVKDDSGSRKKHKHIHSHLQGSNHSQTFAYCIFKRSGISIHT